MRLKPFRSHDHPKLQKPAAKMRPSTVDRIAKYELAMNKAIRDLRVAARIDDIHRVIENLQEALK